MIHTQPCILLIEDHELLQLSQHWLLTQLGCRVVIAKNAIEAQGYLFPSQPPMTTFDLVLIDLGLPPNKQLPNVAMDGIHLCRRLRQFYSSQSLPIAALMAFDADYKEKECVAAGMQYFFTKPLSIEQWRQVVEIASGITIQ